MTIAEIRLTGQDLFILRRWWMGLPSHPDVQPVNGLVARITSTLDANKPEHRQIAEQLFQDYIAAIFGTDPNTPPVQKEPEIFIPPLPKEARLTDKALKAEERVGGWYKQTVQWLVGRSPMTPHHFLEAGTAWLLGLAINRRICIEVHEQIYPCLYVLIVAETSKYAKSTGLKAIDSLVFHTMPHMLIPGSTTTEGMTEILSGELPVNFDKLSLRDQALIQAGQKFAGQRGVLLDEYSSLLGSMKKDYMHGFVELLMKLYDNRPAETYHTRSGGMMIINYPAISIMGATTPSAMARSLTHEMWVNGAMARYLVMFRERALPYNSNYGSFTPPPEITKPLGALHSSLPAIKVNDHLEDDNQQFIPIFAQISRDAFTAYEAYAKALRYDMIGDDIDERLHGNYMRAHVMALKIALGIASMDWQQAGQDGPVTISLGHWAMAQQLVEKGRASLHRLLPVMSETRDTRTRKSLLSVLKGYPEGLTLTELADKLGVNNKDIRSAVEMLVDSNQIEAHEYRPHTGRPTVTYRVLGG